jgi:hypothetical protein
MMRALAVSAVTQFKLKTTRNYGENSAILTLKVRYSIFEEATLNKSVHNASLIVYFEAGAILS